jgi:hypothetical protein
LRKGLGEGDLTSAPGQILRDQPVDVRVDRETRHVKGRRTAISAKPMTTTTHRNRTQAATIFSIAERIMAIRSWLFNLPSKIGDREDLSEID